MSLFKKWIFLYPILGLNLSQAEEVGLLTPDQEHAIRLCDSYLSHHEVVHNMPPQLLRAISTRESGKSLPTGHVRPWPWTINVRGKGQFFPTKEAAIRAVRQLLALGIRNIDVGCMQISLLHHPKAFSSLHEAFDPHANIAYACAFLKKLKQRHGHWIPAIAHYHSSNPSFYRVYLRKVLQLWEKLLQKKPHATHPHGGVRSPSPRRVFRSQSSVREVPASLSPLPGNYTPVRRIRALGLRG